MTKTAIERIKRGGVVLIQGNLDGLEGVIDGLMETDFECVDSYPTALQCGTNSVEIKEVLEKYNPDDEFSDLLLEAIIDELETRAPYVAYPGATAQVAAQEGGPMDEPDDQHKQVLGTHLSDRAKAEAELLGGLHHEGFPEDAQERRAESLKLPRATRASIRRLHTMLLHKPTPVMIQIMKGAGVAE